MINTRATGRNGDDTVWAVANSALIAGEWGVALEAVRSMNVFFTAHAVDMLVELPCLAQAPRAGIADKLVAEIRTWNRAVESR